MRRCTDPLALDPLSPIGISPIADISSTRDPLAPEPLSAPSARGRPVDSGFVAADAALGPPRPSGQLAPGRGIRRGTHPDTSGPMRDRS
jgi:hypothetical protein